MNLLQETLAKIAPQNAEARAAAHSRLEQLTMPHWALGRLMDMAEDLAGITGSLKPAVTRRAVVVFAGDHGVTAEGVSLYPQEVTCQMVYNFVHGGAGINALSRVSGARVVVVDMGVAGDLTALAESGAIVRKWIGPGTKNIARGPAMTRDEAIRAVEAGIEVANALVESTDVLGTGEMGIGNTTPSSAIVAALTGATPDEATGCGTGIDEEARQKKALVIRQILDVNAPDTRDGLDVLAKIGGFEIGGIAGLILGAAAARKPVLIDGFISTAGALVAQALAPAAADFMLSAHHSIERGHRLALARLGKRPLLDLGLRLGEGTGAALAMTLVEASARILTEVATFAEAGVSEAE